MYSNAKGLSWVRLRSPELRNERIAHMWAAPTGEIFAGNYSGRIFRSVNGGGSWSLIFDRARANVGCWSPALQGFTTDPAGNYYVGYIDDGVYRSSDRGITWDLLNAGLPTTSSCDHQVYLPMTFGVSQDGHILAGTDQGVYRSTQPIRALPLRHYDFPTQDLGPTRTSLAQNYPNPFNPATTIEFELASDALVTVKVYNTLGQEVAAPARAEEFGAGSNEIAFDGSTLPSGVYFYRMTAEDLQTGEATISGIRKMTLVR
jgi:hypothetical protein